MNRAEATLTSSLSLLERYARERRQAERLALATRTLELHPLCAEAQRHRVLALCETQGFEPALAALHEASTPLLARGERLPPALLETYRALALWGSRGQPAPFTAGEILEVSPAATTGLYRVRFASGIDTQMSAAILERVYGLRVGVNAKSVH